MGIHDRGAVIRANHRVPLILAAIAFSFAILFFPDAAFARKPREYRCVPDVKYECSPDQCEKLTEGFQAAEYFGYRPSTGKLSACLWTNCYAGMATVLKNSADRSLTAIGRLAPTAHPGNKPIIVSLTIETSGNNIKDGGSFTAIWGYGSEWLTFDMGKCKPRRGR